MKAPHRAAWVLTVINAMHMHELRIVCDACILYHSRITPTLLLN